MCGRAGDAALGRDLFKTRCGKTQPPPTQSDLLPDMSAHVPDDQNMRNHANKTFFKKPLALLDSRLTPHTVTYDSLVSSGQRHTRLSAGWSGLMRHLGAAQGDTVVLELRGPRAAGMLHVRLESGGQ